MRHTAAEQLRAACAAGLLTEQQVQDALDPTPRAPTPPPVPTLPPIPAHVEVPLDADMDADLEWTDSFDLEAMVALLDAQAPPLQRSMFGSGSLPMEDDPLLLDVLPDWHGDDVLLQLQDMH